MLVWRSNAIRILVIGTISLLVPSAVSGYPVEPAWFGFVLGMFGFDLVLESIVSVMAVPPAAQASDEAVAPTGAGASGQRATA